MLIPEFMDYAESDYSSNDIITKRIKCEISRRFFASPPDGGFAQNDRHLCF